MFVIHTSVSTRLQCVLTSEHHWVMGRMKHLADLKSITVDKGSAMVNITTESHIDEMNQYWRILWISNWTTQLTMCKLRKIIIWKLHILLLHGCISELRYGLLKPKSSGTLCVLGSPKIHKGVAPLRPISSTQNLLHRTRTLWVANILNPTREMLMPRYASYLAEFAKLLENLQLITRKTFYCRELTTYKLCPIMEGQTYCVILFFLQTFFSDTCRIY